MAAEGERQSAVLHAEGLAGALEAVTASASEAGPNTMVLQYLDALRQMASAPSTKFVLPMELTNLLAGVRSLAEQFPSPEPRSQDQAALTDASTADVTSYEHDSDSANGIKTEKGGAISP